MKFIIGRLYQYWKYSIEKNGTACCDTHFNWLSIAAPESIIRYAVDIRNDLINSFGIVGNIKTRSRSGEPVRPLIRHWYGYCCWISFQIFFHRPWLIFAPDTDTASWRPEIHCESYVYRPILGKPIDLALSHDTISKVRTIFRRSTNEEK